jgi:hypothetical protein
MIVLKKMRWAEHMTCMREIRDAYILVGDYEGRDHSQVLGKIGG